MKKTWLEILKDPRWQKKRLEVLQASNWKCDNCDETTKTLHVHHGTYDNTKLPWQYPRRQLHVLCEDCHSHAHAMQGHLKDAISNMKPNEIERVYGYACGMLLKTGILKSTNSGSDEYLDGITDAVTAERNLEIHEKVDKAGVFRITLELFSEK